MVFSSIKNFHELDQKGWIIGPQEKEDAYLERIKTVKGFFSNPPEDIDQFLTDRDWALCNQITHTLFDVAPDWILAYYSNSNLSFFQGAATWIVEKQGVRIPIVQLKERFEEGKLLGFYTKKEVLSHEAVHAVRMQFDEPVFEEFFAYKTSPHWGRRILGPVFQYPWEGYLFICLLFIPITVEIVGFFLPTLNFLPFFNFFPLAFAFFLFLRLTFLHIVLRVALNKLSKFLLLAERKWAVALRMKDREIFRFCFLSKKRLTGFLNKEDSFRWKVLRKSYFKTLH